MSNNQLHPDTLVVSSGRPHGPGQPLNHPPIFASNFVIGGGDTLEYARDGSNQSWSAFEKLVSDLEGGGKCTSFSSGMAAISSVFQTVPSNGNIALPTDCYGGVVALVNAGKETHQWNVKRIEAGDTTTWIEVIEKGYDLVWLEGVTNPMVEVSDIEAICKTSRPPTTLVCVDCTFSTPLNLKPLNKGADVSVHSATKFFGGHSDLLCGVVTTRNEKLHHKIEMHREIHGALPGAMETFLAIRGSRTLALRLERAQQNALTLAERLSNHPMVLITRYPGLPSHPQHEVAKRNLERGFGTIVTFDVKGGAKEGDLVCQSTKLIIHATSLGAVESTMERRAAIPGSEHLPPNLLRLSVGVENVEDLWNDLQQAFNQIQE